MQRIMLKSKIHGAIVTEANIAYVGSVSIDENLMKKTNILAHEKVEILDITNGERLSTYAIKAKAGSKEICINGAAAHKIHKGDKVIILSYCILSDSRAKTFKPKVIFLDQNNSIKK